MAPPAPLDEAASEDEADDVTEEAPPAPVALLTEEAAEEATSAELDVALDASTSANPSW
jgi:hypothetical protein